VRQAAGIVTTIGAATAGVTAVAVAVAAVEGVPDVADRFVGPAAAEMAAAGFVSRYGRNE
jgi:hypothetical protein